MAQRKDEEATRLALESLGSRLASTSTYEASVIRDATFSSAPILTGIGYPDLRTLAPSYNPKTGHEGFQSDIPHFLTVLRRTQSALAELLESDPSQIESKEANIFRMKIQMLTFFLQTHASTQNMSKEDWLPIKSTQRSEDKKRSIALTSNSKVTSLTREDLQKRLNDKKSRRMKELQKNARLTRSQRLEEIKKGTLNDGEDDCKYEKSTSLSFGAQILCKRKSMMDWKKINCDTIEPHGDNKEDYWVEILLQKQARREARRERRKLRLEQVQEESVKKVHSVKIKKESEECEGGSTSEEEFEFQDDDNQQKKYNELSIQRKKSASSSSMNGTFQPDNIVSASSLEAATPKTFITSSDMGTSTDLSCPLCQRSFPRNNMSEVEANLFINNHMERCQRRSRKRKPIGTYNDDIRDRKLPLQNNVPFQSRRDDNHTDIDDISDDDGYILAGDIKSTSKRKYISSKSKASKKNNPKRYKSQIRTHKRSSKKNSLDDFELPVYTDRVEDWMDDFIIAASSGSQTMSEKDPNEKPPGMVIYPPNLIVPAWINNRLFGYQRTGLKWMYELFQQQSGGIVGDEMGLGKTVQICAYLQSMIISRQISSILIVCPATLLIHWLQELAKWAPGLRRILIHKAGERADGFSRDISRGMLKSLDKWISIARKEYSNEPLNEKDLEEEIEYSGLEDGFFCGSGYVVVTTFESVRRKSEVWTSHEWDYIIVDEGQKIRNPDAEVTLACKRFRTSQRLLLSGTPIQNDLRELWSLFDFVFPGRLGTLPTYETEFADPIKRGGYSNASPMQVQIAYRSALVLRDLINPYLLRRQKKDVKEVSRMPGKTEQVLFCRLSNKQRSLYKSYLASDEVKNVIRGTIQSFRAITNLRKICNHPHLMGDTDDRFSKLSDSSSEEDGHFQQNVSDMQLVNDSGKLEVLAKILPLWKKQGHRVLLFCQWKKMLNILQKFVVKQEWKFFRMDGNTNVASRQQMVDKYNNDESIFLMLMTTRTGGVGLNLTGADRIIIYDPDWNPQTDIQARERSYRFGQKNHVTIYRLITAGTIEEKIYHRQIFKTAMSNQVLQDPKQRRLFTRKDLKDLFTLKEDVHSIQGGGDGKTETVRIIKGNGVINPENLQEKTAGSSKDNTDTLNAVLRSKGLAGIFEHDSLGLSSTKKTIADFEMEEAALAQVEKAAERLESSVPITTIENQYEPTWTGSEDNKSEGLSTRGAKKKLISSKDANNSNMFGRNEQKQRNDQNDSSSRIDMGFGGANIVGARKASAALGQSSTTLLSNLRNRRQDLATINIE